MNEDLKPPIYPYANVINAELAFIMAELVAMRVRSKTTSGMAYRTADQIVSEIHDLAEAWENHR